MDRIINVKVGGNHLTKDGKNAGTRGEANVTNLRIEFGLGWDGYAKTIVFVDAHGMNPTKRTLTTDLLENAEESTRIYLVPIPPEALGVAGTLTFSIEGWTDGKRQRSVSDTLVVKDALITDVITEVSPDQIEQMQAQYEDIIEQVQDAYVSKSEAEAFAGEAKSSKETAEAKATEAGNSATDAQASADRAEEEAQKSKESAEDAEEYATKAEATLGKTSYIGDNGNWYAWDSIESEFYDTGVKAQSGSVVYLGDNPPADADVWIDPNGESALYAPYIGENENWYVFDPETQIFIDSGLKAVAKDGYTPIKGVDYRDGISCTHSWNGTTLTVKSESGESSADLKGEKGDKGAQGDKGDKGNMQSVYLRYDEATGNLYYSSDGIVTSEEYIDTGSFADKADIGSMDTLKTSNKTNLVAAINELYDLLRPSYSFVVILGGAENWTAEDIVDGAGNVIGTKYGQVVNVNNAIVTERSKVDLVVTIDQAAIFKEKDISFSTVNRGGVVTVYCEGKIPDYNYKIQVTVTEVSI